MEKPSTGTIPTDTWRPAKILVAAILLVTTATAAGQQVDAPTDGDEPTQAISLPPLDPAALTALAADLRTRYAKPPPEWPVPELEPGVALNELGTPGIAPAPPENPTTPEKAQLGLSLFFDPRLSRSQQISCASCHAPELGWADGRTLGSGNFRRSLKRHTPSLLGAGHSKVLFWDGRQTTLEDQAMDVITNPDEMDADPDEVAQRLKLEAAYYGPLFTKAFGDAAITLERVVQALAAFQRNISVGRTPFDRFVNGKHGSLSDEAVRGLHLFRTKARCLNCHGGPMFQDNSFHNLGLTYYGRKYEDLGRHIITGRPEDVGKFKTPTLRNVARTGPWMHNGFFPSLEGVLRLYNAGMPRPRPKSSQSSDPLFPETDPLLRPLKMTSEELADLKAFLESLNEPTTRMIAPPFPPVKAVSDG